MADLMIGFGIIMLMTVLMTVWGTILYSPGQFKIVSPVRISLGQIFTGNYIQISVPD